MKEEEILRNYRKKGMRGLNRAAQFLKDSGTFFLATDDGGKPRVRPFGAVAEFEGKTYLSTSTTKACYRQMLKNPNIQIAAVKGEDWIRITGEAVPDPREQAKRKMMDENPVLRTIYQAGDKTFTVLYLKNASATLYRASGEKETFSL